MVIVFVEVQPLAVVVFIVKVTGIVLEVAFVNVTLMLPAPPEAVPVTSPV